MTSCPRNLLPWLACLLTSWTVPLSADAQSVKVVDPPRLLRARGDDARTARQLDPPTPVQRRQGDIAEQPLPGGPSGFGPIGTLSADIDLPPKLAETERALSAEAKDADGESKALEDYAATEFERFGAVRYATGRSHRVSAVGVGPVAGDFCYRPLYFEEANLERYGNTRGCLQPAVSAARFFVTVPALPYLMTLEHPDVCYYWSRPYEAGRPAPRVREMPPFDLRAGAVTGGLATGLIFLIP